MKRTHASGRWLLAAGILLGVVGCQGSGSDQKAGSSAVGQMEQHGTGEGANMASETGSTVRFAVHGMHCENCVAAINHALSEQAGVITHKVSLADSTAEVSYDPKKVSPADLKAVINELGYTAEDKL